MLEKSLPEPVNHVGGFELIHSGPLWLPRRFNGSLQCLSAAEMKFPVLRPWRKS